MTSDHACITGIKNRAPRMENAARNTEAAVARGMSAAPSPGDQGDGGRQKPRRRPRARSATPGWQAGVEAVARRPTWRRCRRRRPGRVSWWRAGRTACSTVAGQAHDGRAGHGSRVWEEAAREVHRVCGGVSCPTAYRGDADHAAAGLHELVNGACHVACWPSGFRRDRPGDARATNVEVGPRQPAFKQALCHATAAVPRCFGPEARPREQLSLLSCVLRSAGSHGE